MARQRSAAPATAARVGLIAVDGRGSVRHDARGDPHCTAERRAAPPGAHQPLLRGFEAQLRERFGCRLQEITLFGSWARGEAHGDSDLDVLVIVDDLSAAERREIWDLGFRLDSDKGEPLWHLSPLCYSAHDAAALRSRERRLMIEIAEQGIPI